MPYIPAQFHKFNQFMHRSLSGETVCFQKQVSGELANYDVDLLEKRDYHHLDTLNFDSRVFSTL